MDLVIMISGAACIKNYQGAIKNRVQNILKEIYEVDAHFTARSKRVGIIVYSDNVESIFELQSHKDINSVIRKVTAFNFAKNHLGGDNVEKGLNYVSNMFSRSTSAIRNLIIIANDVTLTSDNRVQAEDAVDNLRSLGVDITV